MQLTLLGTAAAEGWPAPFCRCDHCETARQRGGPNIRSRSGVPIDDDLKIDFSADTLMQMQRLNRCLDRLRTIVFTHQHSDHLAPPELEWMTTPFTQTPPAQPIAVYGNAHVMRIIEATPDFNFARLPVTLTLLEPFRAVRTPVGDTILPLPADHTAGALVLRITRARDNKTFLYGHDSGLYPEETLAALAKHPLDLALFDCTNGGVQTSNRGHMGIRGVVQMVGELRARGAVTPATRLVATHFSHNGGLLHEELVQAFLPHGITVAYDGVTFDIT